MKLCIASGRKDNIRMMKGSFGDTVLLKFNNREFLLPYFYVVEISYKITLMLALDRSNNTIELSNIEFLNKKNEEEIFEMLESNEIFINCDNLNYKDCIDFANFGELIGNEDFKIPLTKSIDENQKTINKDNVTDLIDELSFYSVYSKKETSFKREIDFIVLNFPSMCKEEKFKSWCQKDRNSCIVESIIMDEKLKLRCEDDLLMFLINQKDNSLFKYLNLKLCNKKSIQEFWNYYSKAKSCKAGLDECLHNFIINDSKQTITLDKLKNRYTDTNYINQIIHSKEEAKDDEINKLKEVLINILNKEAGDGNLEIVKIIIEEGGIKCTNKFPLFLAIVGDHLDVVKYLVTKCKLKIENKDIIDSASEEIKDYLRSKII